jgi:hypothetical protein
MTRIAFRHPDTGRYARVNPTPVPGKTGDARWPVRFDAPEAGAHETCELTQITDKFFVRFIEANRTLTLLPDGQVETRVAGTQDEWESLFATEQPDGPFLLYRRNGDLLIGPYVFEVLPETAEVQA